MTGQHQIRGGHWAALLALLLFAVAVVKSDLMRIAMATPAADCAGMGGHAMASTATSPVTSNLPRSGLPAKGCAFCDTAAHPPLIATALPIPLPWAMPWSPVQPHGVTRPRAPPSVRARARAPPIILVA